MLWIVIVIRCDEQLNMVHYKACNEIDCKIAHLGCLWVNISWQLTTNMLRMNGYLLIRARIILVNWCVFLMKPQKISSKFIQFVCHLLAFETQMTLDIYWGHEVIVLISWKQRTHHANIGVIPLVGRWMKTCMDLSSILLKLLCKKLGTLLSIVMKSQQLTINLGVTFACVFCGWF
jgi:hypothetical protein